jgi:hypothetical protein
MNEIFWLIISLTLRPNVCTLSIFEPSILFSVTLTQIDLLSSEPQNSSFRILKRHNCEKSLLAFLGLAKKDFFGSSVEKIFKKSVEEGNTLKSFSLSFTRIINEIY